MTSGFETVANSSSGSGLIVSLEKGKRSESFMNTQQYWYFASELVLQGSYQSFETKMPDLGALSIFQASWRNDDQRVLVAKFPRGSWEYVRMLPKAEEADGEFGNTQTSDDESRNYCPLGCRVRGWADLGEETKAAHMEFLHTGKIRKSPFQ